MRVPLEDSAQPHLVPGLPPLEEQLAATTQELQTSRENATKAHQEGREKEERISVGGATSTQRLSL